MKTLRAKLPGILSYRSEEIRQLLHREDLFYVITLTLTIVSIFMSGFIFSVDLNAD